VLLRAGVAISVLFALNFVACIPVPAKWFDKIQQPNMAPRLHYQGFSFARPPNHLWYFRQSEQSLSEVILRRDFWAPSKTHTFIAHVHIGLLDQEPMSHEHFGILARFPEQEGPYPIRSISYEQSLTTQQGQWCVRFESQNVAIGPPAVPDSELAILFRGYRCVHPAWPLRTLDFFYSERGLEAELQPKLYEEGQLFLNGVRIDIEYDVPAV
jgi:hypothetical protein